MLADRAVSENIHFRILEDIARDLSGDINFPTCMDAAILVRNTLKDPFADLGRVAQVIGIEPLISSKLLRLANSVRYNPAGTAINQLSVAVSRLGFEVVRTVSLAVAMDQMLKSRNLAVFDRIAHAFWEHSIQVAAIARVLVRRVGRISPDEAMLAGLVHDIGIFYLLYRAAEYPEYRSNQAAVFELLRGWHESIGESLLYILGLPEHVVEAVREHDQFSAIQSPTTLADVLYLANLLAGLDPEWQEIDGDPADAEKREADRLRYADLMEEAAEDIQELRSSLGA